MNCAWCEELEATETCDICGNDFCENCIDDHRHCINCGGTGEQVWNVMRNSAGEPDYLHGEPTGETGSEPCRRCDQTGLEM